jgi:hypothetical protein
MRGESCTAPNLAKLLQSLKGHEDDVKPRAHALHSHDARGHIRYQGTMFSGPKKMAARGKGTDRPQPH